MTDPGQGEWARRFVVVGHAQGRYLLWLSLSGLFYYALDLDVSSSTLARERLAVPFAGIELATRTVWAAAPSVLGFLLLATLGATEALRAAAANIGRREITEELNESFNILDAVSYTGSNGHPFVRRLVGLVYPAVLSVFWVEAAVILTVLFGESPDRLFPQIEYPFWQSVSAWMFRSLGTLFVVFALRRLTSLWITRLSVREV